MKHFLDMEFKDINLYSDANKQEFYKLEGSWQVVYVGENVVGVIGKSASRVEESGLSKDIVFYPWDRIQRMSAKE